MAGGIRGHGAAALWALTEMADEGGSPRHRIPIRGSRQPPHGARHAVSALPASIAQWHGSHVSGSEPMLHGRCVTGDRRPSDRRAESVAFTAGGEELAIIGGGGGAFAAGAAAIHTCWPNFRTTSPLFIPRRGCSSEGGLVDTSNLHARRKEILTQQEQLQARYGRPCGKNALQWDDLCNCMDVVLVRVRLI